jgi:chemotaxis protein CheC
MKPLQLTQREHDILTEVATIGAGHAIGPVSKLINARIDIAVPILQLARLEDVPEIMGEAEQEMTVVMVKIKGGATGTILLVMHPQDAIALVSGIAAGQEASALEEIGNILAGSSLGALGHFLDLTLLQSVPGSATDMLRAMVNEITAELGTQTDHILVLGVNFQTTQTRIGGRLYFLFDPASTQKILATSRAKTGETDAPQN